MFYDDGLCEQDLTEESFEKPPMYTAITLMCIFQFVFAV